jgi:L-fuconolactonase
MLDDRSPCLSRSDQSPLIIDSHVHVLEQSRAFPFDSSAAFPPFVTPKAVLTPEALIELMKANGVALTVLIQHICYRWDNSYLADVLKRYPDKFKGVCRVNPEDPAAPEHLSMAVQEQGFRGVRISPFEDARFDWIRGPLMLPLWRRCNELKVPMTILTDHSRLKDLLPLIEQNPDLVVVIDHMADIRPEMSTALRGLLDLARYPGVFIKISHLWSISHRDYPYADAQDQVKRVYDAFGPRRIMWATDYPVSSSFLTYADALALYRDHLGFLSNEDRNQILGKTVQEVWPFGL